MLARCLWLFLLIQSPLLHAKSNTLPGFNTFTQPDSISCGPTAASMLLNYYGIDAGIGPLKTRAGTRWLEAGGFKLGMTLPGNLTEAIQSYGLRVDLVRGNTNDLINYIDQGRPPILLVRSGRGTWHYFVVVGYDNDGAGFFVADPQTGTFWWNTRDALEASWRYSADIQGNYIPDDHCGNCHGSGKIWTKCPICGGSGWIKDPIFHTKNKCISCSGRGKWSAHCPICFGKGNLGDLPRKLVESAGASGNSMIVPYFSSPKVPGNRFALSCIHNKTDVPIRLEFRWGEQAPWQSQDIAAGYIGSYWWNYQFINQNNSPKLYIKFNSNLSQGEAIPKEYWVPGYSSPHTDCNLQSNREEFQRQPTNPNALDLYHFE